DMEVYGGGAEGAVSGVGLRAVISAYAGAATVRAKQSFGLRAYNVRPYTDASVQKDVSIKRPR
ncbi:MAG: hypothetical protein K2P04_03935, partial [Oscillospiraceae bacterium]|nr:hypothetical protein [Oscillospiraceae bacterium]